MEYVLGQHSQNSPEKSKVNGLSTTTFVRELSRSTDRDRSEVKDPRCAMGTHTKSHATLQGSRHQNEEPLYIRVIQGSLSMCRQTELVHAGGLAVKRRKRSSATHQERKTGRLLHIRVKYPLSWKVLGASAAGMTQWIHPVWPARIRQMQGFVQMPGPDQRG